MKDRTLRQIKARIGTGPMTETVEKVLAELIFKASVARAKRLKIASNLEPIIAGK